MKKISSIDFHARKMSYIPGSDKYKLPLEGDWASQLKGKANFNKERKMTINDEIFYKAQFKDKSTVGSDKYSVVYDYKHPSKVMEHAPREGHAAMAAKSPRRAVTYEITQQAKEHDGPKYKDVDLVSYTHYISNNVLCLDKIQGE